MCEWSRIYDESEWSLMISLIRRWDSRLRIARVVLSGKCVVHTHSAWTTCRANEQNPNEATFRYGSFDRWDVDQEISA